MLVRQWLRWLTYHVLLTWLSVTAVTPDRLETTRNDARTLSYFLLNTIYYQNHPDFANHTKVHALHIADQHCLDCHLGQ
jgi:hypothetical protein